MNTRTPNTLPARRGRSLAVAALVATMAFLPVAPSASAQFTQRDRVVPAGTEIRFEVQTPIRSTTVNVNDEFRAEVTDPVTVSGVPVIPAGFTIVGHVIGVSQAKAWGQPSGVTIQLDKLLNTNGKELAFAGEITDLNGRPMTTVENLTAGTELMARIARSLTVPEWFYAVSFPGGGQGSDIFDSIATVQQAQSVLRDLGYYSGPIDGRLSATTRASIQLFQRDQRLRQTGFLDRETIDRLGLLGEQDQEVQAVTVLSADALIDRGNQLQVRISVQTPTGGWRVFEDHFLRRDTLHVYVRGLRPGGINSQAQQTHNLTVSLTPQDWQSITRIVVHGSGRDVTITKEVFASAGALTLQEAQALEQQVTRMLSDYARALGVRYISVNNQIFLTRANYRENEIELLFALNSLASTSRLYTQLIRATTDPQALQGANDLYVAQANMVDRAVARTRSGRAAVLARTWDTVKVEFERLDNSADRDFNRSEPGYR